MTDKQLQRVLRGAAIAPSAASTSASGRVSMEMMEELLNQEQVNKPVPSWNKLTSSQKTSKLMEFAVRHAERHHYDEATRQALMLFLRECVDKKRLERVKDVVYDAATQQVLEVPDLLHRPVVNRFTLRKLQLEKNKQQQRTLKHKVVVSG